MTLLKNYSLRPYNTFGIEVNAHFYKAVQSIAELKAAALSAPKPVLILGGGSNVIFKNDFPGTVLRNAIKGIAIKRRFKNKVHIEVGGGEIWHEMVLWSLKQGFGGLENMSLIPGTVGAAPIQNIGAYGVELKDVLVRLQAMDLETGKMRTFTKAQCQFGYRNSIFKQAYRQKYAIVSVVFSLTVERHQLKLSYGDIAGMLAKKGINHPTPNDISAAIIAIRSSKLPDPAVLGNCGSFFKNPEIDRELYAQLIRLYPEMPGFPQANNTVKIPAGWLIEQCGWKGKRQGNLGCYEKQALVLVNFGGASGEEVSQFAAAIIHSVFSKFKIALEPEVNII